MRIRSRNEMSDEPASELLMNEMVLIALTGFGIAFFHAAIPTHWLPFVITARAQRWDRNKTICVTALAGTGHVLVTAILGVLIAWFGIALHDKIEAWFPLIAGGTLLLFGLFYVYRQFSGRPRAQPLVRRAFAPRHRPASSYARTPGCLSTAPVFTAGR